MSNIFNEEELTSIKEISYTYQDIQNSLDEIEKEQHILQARFTELCREIDRLKEHELNILNAVAQRIGREVTIQDVQNVI